MLLISLVLFSAKKNESEASFSTPSEPKSFQIEIYQKGKRVGITNNEVALQKAPFDIVITFIDTAASKDILLNTSINPKTFLDALQNVPMDSLAGFQESGMAEVLFNEDRDVLLYDSAPSFWFYDSDELHRFNLVKKDGKNLICTRTIESLYSVETKESIALNKVSYPIYMVFITYEYNKDFSHRIENQRFMLKINWI